MIYLDFSQDYQYLFQDPASPMANGIIDLHHYVMFFLFVILCFVLVMLSAIVDLFIFHQTIRKISNIILRNNYYGQSFIVHPKRARDLLLNRLNNHFEKNGEIEDKRHQINTSCVWNNVWSDLHEIAGNKNLTAVNVNLNNNTNVSLISNVSSKGIFISGDKKFVSSAINNISSYIVSIYLRRKNYNTDLPNVAVNRAILKLKNDTIESAVITNVFQSYHLNLYYWMQTYYTLRSGIYNFTHSTFIEIVWTVIPSLVLVFIGVPSFILLYAMDEIIEPDLVVKCIGHQWYWTYEIEYPNYFYNSDIDLSYLNSLDNNIDVNSSDWWDIAMSKAIAISKSETEQMEDGVINLENIRWGYLNFSSNIATVDNLEKGAPRLLEVDNPLFLPVKTHIDLLVTSNDVLHCWTVPSFGVKMDAVPGRLNHANVFIERSGVFYGQCSEICGVLHGFMPIKVVAVNLREFLTKVNS